MSSANKESFMSSFAICTYLTELDRTSDTMLNMSGEKGYP